MKTLIFTLVFSFQALAAGTTSQNEVDPEINQKLISVAKDVENERILEGVSDLEDCKRGFRPSQTGATASELSGLQDCISKKFQGKSAEEIKSISDRLSLETYNLIPSKTVQNVTDYLSKKLYKNLTGVDLDERSREQRIKNLRFGVKKQIDQKEFFDLYKNQVAKNVLYEVSRFCFLDLRLDVTPPAPTDNFMNHWDQLTDFAQSNHNPPVTDTGTPFTSQNSAPAPTNGQSPQSSASSYQDIFKGIFGSNDNPIQDPKLLANFFDFCGKKINELCTTFENGKGGATVSSSTVTDVASANTMKGARACLAKSRLTAYRRAINASDEIYAEFIKDGGQSISIALDRNQMVKRYEGGRGANEKSLNALTNNAAYDFFEGTKNLNNSDAEECERTGDDNACEKFIVVDDSRKNIQNNTDLVYLAKKEAERARIAALVQGNQQTLDEFLEKNYPDLKAKLDKGDIQKSDLENLVAGRWEAKREAMQQEILGRLGKRQITESEAGQQSASDPNKTVKQEYAKDNAKEALNEKARLAQVVFFNNIISSSLELKKAGGQSLGRNVGAITNEIEAGRSEVQSPLFDNLQSNLGSNNSGGSNSGLSGNETITNIDFLDDFIGIPRQQNGQNGQTGTGQRNP